MKNRERNTSDSVRLCKGCEVFLKKKKWKKSHFKQKLNINTGCEEGIAQKKKKKTLLRLNMVVAICCYETWKKKWNETSEHFKFYRSGGKTIKNKKDIDTFV